MTAVATEDQDRAHQLLALLRRRPRLAGDDGTSLELPPRLVDALTDLLEATAAGQEATVLRSANDITTQQAADILGVSRPTVVRMIEAGRLPAHLVGTHRRLTLADVLTERAQRTARRGKALDQMVADAEELGLYD